MKNLTKAFQQWATRPADERFWNLADMAKQCLEYRNQAVTADVRYQDLRIEPAGNQVVVVGPQGRGATLSHFAFSQLCARAKAPAGYLRKLPTELAAQNLNHGIQRWRGGDTDEASMLFHREEGAPMVCRATLSQNYQRIWNHEVLDLLMDNLPEGWRPPPARPAGYDSRARPATEADCLNRRDGILSIKPGDMIAPGGLYASEKDMFLFLINEDLVIDDGTDEGVARGVMLWNSEVGDRSFGGMSFNYKHVCGNHIVWDASNVMEFKFPHTGRVRSKARRQLQSGLRQYATSSAFETEKQIKSARGYELGPNKEAVIDLLNGFTRKKRIPITEDRLRAAYDVAEKHESWYNTTPNTVWGMVNGLTELSQQSENADERTKLDRAAGKVMQIAF